MASPSEYEAAFRIAKEKAAKDVPEEAIAELSAAVVDAAEAARRAAAMPDPVPMTKHEETPKRVRAAKAHAHVRRSRKAA